MPFRRLSDAFKAIVTVSPIQEIHDLSWEQIMPSPWCGVMCVRLLYTAKFVLCDKLRAIHHALCVVGDWEGDDFLIN